MADKDDVVVNVDDPDTIVVNVDDVVLTEDQPEVRAKPEPKPRKARVMPEETPGPSPDQVIEELRANADREKRAREAAEATAASERARADAAERNRVQAQKDAEEYQQRAESTEMTLIDGNIAAAQSDLEAQQDAYTRAAEAGEYAKMAQIQTKIAKAAAALDRYEDAKASLESSRAAASTRAAATPAPTAPANQTEQFLASFSPVAQSWLRQHMDCLPPAYGGDFSKNAAMMEGHYAATRQRIAEGTPEYFRVIEEHLGLRQPVAPPQPAPEPPQPRTHTKVQHAAPPSREAPEASGQTQPRNVREVRLTKEQQEIARLTWPHKSDQEAFGLYATNLLAAMAEGKIGRTTH